MTEEPHITPGVRRIDNAAPGALMRVTEERAHEIVSTLIDTGAWIVIGQTGTGQTKFGPRK